jgi:hypothetical protein
VRCLDRHMGMLAEQRLSRTQPGCQLKRIYKAYAQIGLRRINSGKSERLQKTNLAQENVCLTAAKGFLLFAIVFVRFYVMYILYILHTLPLYTKYSSVSKSGNGRNPFFFLLFKSYVRTSAFAHVYNISKN